MANPKKILKAFANPVPADQDWYQRRMEACTTCEFNTKNMKEEEVPFLEDIKINRNIPGLKKPLCPEGSCLFCGCCVDRKSSVKSEFCAIKKVIGDPSYAKYKPMLKEGQQPKWDSVEALFPTDAKISCFTDSENVVLTRDSRSFVLEFKNFDPIVEATIRVTRKPEFDFKSFTVGCGCTVPAAKKIDDTTVEFNIRVVTQTFREGLNEKTMEIQYFKNGNTVATIPVKLKITKP